MSTDTTTTGSADEVVDIDDLDTQIDPPPSHVRWYNGDVCRVVNGLVEMELVCARCGTNGTTVYVGPSAAGWCYAHDADGRFLADLRNQVYVCDACTAQSASPSPTPVTPVDDAAEQERLQRERAAREERFWAHRERHDTDAHRDALAAAMTEAAIELLRVNRPHATASDGVPALRSAIRMWLDGQERQDPGVLAHWMGAAGIVPPFSG